MGVLAAVGGGDGGGAACGAFVAGGGAEGPVVVGSCVPRCGVGDPKSGSDGATVGRVGDAVLARDDGESEAGECGCGVGEPVLAVVGCGEVEVGAAGLAVGAAVDRVDREGATDGCSLRVGTAVGAPCGGVGDRESAVGERDAVGAGTGAAVVGVVVVRVAVGLAVGCGIARTSTRSCITEHSGSWLTNSTRAGAV